MQQTGLKLYMIMLGCRPQGRHTEQHDIFFGIGKSIKELIPAIKQFWPEAKGKIHIDAWREVSGVDGHSIAVTERPFMQEQLPATEQQQLFFINLGGYRSELFDELHYKLLAVAADSGQAVRKARNTAFYKEVHFPGAASHVDDKFGIDVDELYNVKDILPAHHKECYALSIIPAPGALADELHIGYFKLSSFE